MKNDLFAPPFPRCGYAVFFALSAACLQLVFVAGSNRVAAAEPALTSPISSQSLRPSSANRSGKLFELMPASRTGVDLVHQFPAQAPMTLLQDQGAGAGVCIGDYDNDGWPDLFAANYDQGNRLYRNLGDWRFEDVSERAGVSAKGRWCGGATFVDIDGDGDLDLHVCVFNAPNLLFVNQGNGTFTESARAHGLDFSGASVSMSFADFDRDGDLDGYLVTHRLSVGNNFRLPRSSNEAQRPGIIQSKGGKVEVAPRFRELFDVLDKGNGRVELVIAGQADRLFRNDGSGIFSDVTERAGIRGNDIGLAAAWWDYNSDGWPDLYVSNDYRGPDRLYRNNRDGTFTDVTANVLPHTPWSSMGTDASDINNDGHIDFIATDMAGTTRFRRMMIGDDLEKERWFFQTANPKQYSRNALYLGTGLERVLEVAHLTGLEATDWTWSPKFADFDNDGRVDLFVANGMSRDFLNNDLLQRMKDRDSPGWRNFPVLKEENLAFRNLGDLRFGSVGEEWGLNQISASFGAAAGDFDRDGDLDLVVMNLGEPLSLFQNHEAKNHRLVVRLRGSRSNTWGIGATVRLESKADWQTRFLSQVSGYLSASEPLVHFGLGEAMQAEKLIIQWPDGTEQSFTNLSAELSYSIIQPVPPGGPTKPSPPPLATAPLFLPGHRAAGAMHQETEFDDFAREPLLPWNLSQLGPGLAVGDVDGDGDEDFFLGGAAGQNGSLWLLGADGRFQCRDLECFVRDRASEDMSAVFFDSDSDGDLDLFVVSGGVEGEPGDSSLRDRLYLNDGKGNFAKAPDGWLPDERDSGSVATVADFDRDGDLDLFVGGRCVPGKYLQIPRSHLWQNNGGKFSEITPLVAPNLRESGLVTGAVWSDADNDGWPDLLVAHEWGPVKFFKNERGQLVDRTQEAGLSQRLGLWNGIAARDLDGDGDIDYVVTNFGLNTPYRATGTNPFVIFRGSVQEGGPVHLIEAVSESGRFFPVRSRFALLAAAPFLAEKFPTFQSFATASLDTMFSERWLASAARFEVNTLESGILWNDGHARFAFTPLPQLAQVAPGFGIALSDFDADGHADIFIAQNFFGPHLETGRMDGGMSLLLRGRGKGQFIAIPPVESGVMISGDAKSVVAMDVNGDGWEEIFVGINNGELKSFEHSGKSPNQPLQVRLRGKPGNSHAIGARITVVLDDSSLQSAEVHAGSGYLSQASPAVTFGVPKGRSIKEVSVRWPDGSASSTPVPTGRPLITLQQQ
jgi:hypothetical protein